MDKTRIIGDFLEINSDIIQAEFESKLPKFLKKFKFRKQRKRLLSNVSKLRESNMTLEVDNLIELFSYVYNNFYPETSYKCIKKCKINVDKGIYEAMINFDNQVSVIVIEEETYPKFNISSKIIVRDGVSEGIDIQTDKLFSDNNAKNEILSRINKELLNTICDYIEDIIKPYYGSEENNYGMVEESVLGIDITNHGRTE